VVSAPCDIWVDEFSVWELDLKRRELRAHGVPVRIGGRAVEILAVLVDSAGKLVLKDDLIRRVWPGAIVEENTLQFHISARRKALGHDRDWLKTVSGRGYRLLGNWAVRERKAPIDRAAFEHSRAIEQSFRTNLPVAVSALVGRALAIRRVENALSVHRVVTLTGPGGIGKTTLALEVARSVFASAHGDAFLVDLASLSDPGLVPSAVAGVLDLRLGGGQATAAAIARAIGGRLIHLLLDNCEHLIEAVAGLAETIIRFCSGVSILATSRENLRIEGEYVYRVGPLSVPTEQEQEPDAILAQSAVQLFISRINASWTSLAPAMLLEVAAICRKVDGIPLAIEFAAARVVTLGLSQVAALLDDRFGLLTAGRRTALPRHQTLRATLDWSYNLLPEWERQLLCRAAIFPAGFTLAAASAVLSDARSEPSSTVIEGIANLVAKSLLTFDGTPSAGRWRLLEMIRAYALEKLAESGDEEHVSRLSATYLRDLFRSQRNRPQERVNSEVKATAHREIDNVRAAIVWALSSYSALAIGLELTADSAPLWFQLSLMPEYRQRVERALMRLQELPRPDSELEIRLQVALGYAIWYSGPEETPGTMNRAFERAIALADPVGNSHFQLQALWGVWAVKRASGENENALAAATRYDAIAHQQDDKRSTVLANRMLALTHHDLGNLTRARGHAETVLSRAPHLDPESNDDLQVDAWIAMLTLLARVQWLQGFPDQANATAREAIDTALQMDHWFSICYVLFTAGCPVSLWIGDLSDAQLRLDMLRDRTGLPPGFISHGRAFEAALRLRQGNEADALTASYIEPRVQNPTMARLITLVSAPTISMPFPEDVPCDTPWSLPEVLRVDAELLLWRGGSDAVAAAEAKLYRSLELARQQSARSWELRTALSIARLWMAQGQRRHAKQLLEPIYGKFTEGLDTLDLRSSRALLELLT
jgi:predicted ATPase/DNA-binding winged helix-turn-helix (wHTH) protein